MVPNFCYVIEGELAGLAHPGYGTDLRRALEEMTTVYGIGAVVTLTEEPLPAGVLEDYGVRACHVPIPDFGVPRLEAAARGVEFVRAEIRDGRRVAVHCSAGCGRTGTFLACCLVALRGLSASEAIREVRARRPGSIETVEQEAFVAQWARYHAGQDRQAPGR